MRIFFCSLGLFMRTTLHHTSSVNDKQLAGKTELGTSYNVEERKLWHSSKSRRLEKIEALFAQRDKLVVKFPGYMLCTYWESVLQLPTVRLRVSFHQWVSYFVFHWLQFKHQENIVSSTSILFCNELGTYSYIIWFIKYFDLKYLEHLLYQLRNELIS